MQKKKKKLKDEYPLEIFKEFIHWNSLGMFEIREKKKNFQLKFWGQVQVFMIWFNLIMTSSY